MNCPRCRVTRLVLIDLELKGEHVRLHACSKCDTRWWERNGEPIALEGVLDLATVHR